MPCGLLWAKVWLSCLKYLKYLENLLMRFFNEDMQEWKRRNITKEKGQQKERNTKESSSKKSYR